MTNKVNHTISRFPAAILDFRLKKGSDEDGIGTGGYERV